MPESSKAQIKTGLPEPTLRRLPLYYHFLENLSDDNVGFVSSSEIAQRLGLVPIQVRKDIEITGISGRPRIGYPVEELKKAIEKFLGWNNTTDAFLIGAGNLGAALLGYQGFSQYGLNIIAAFDQDPQKVGTKIRGVKILPISKLEEMATRMSIQIAILTVSAAAAQSIADVLVSAGINGIWNFAPTKISVPGHIIVQHENLASSLAVLSKKVDMSIRKSRNKNK